MMNRLHKFASKATGMSWVKIVMLLFLVAAINLISFSAIAGYRGHEQDACSETSMYAKYACYESAKETYFLALGKCENKVERRQDRCEQKAREEFYSSLEECNEQLDAREEVCDQVGQGPYLPRGINPDDFGPPGGNKYFPLIPGTKYTYKAYEEEDGNPIETIVVQVKDEAREIGGVECRVVQDTVYEGNGSDPDMKIEDTTDWYALNENGDVWYFGEIALNYEDGVVTNIDGSWTFDQEGAKPGINMFKAPKDHLGVTYRQEFALGEAEDLATIVEVFRDRDLFEQEVKSKLGFFPTGVFGNGPFLHTWDFSPLEPGIVEDKYYEKGVGNVLIINVEAGEFEVLTEKTP